MHSVIQAGRRYGKTRWRNKEKKALRLVESGAVTFLRRASIMFDIEVASYEVKGDSGTYLVGVIWGTGVSVKCTCPHGEGEEQEVACSHALAALATEAAEHKGNDQRERWVLEWSMRHR